MFPKGLHDDLIDALAYQDQIAYASEDDIDDFTQIQQYAETEYNAFAI